MGCHHRIAYIFLCLLHVLLLGSLLLPLKDCGPNPFSCPPYNEKTNKTAAIIFVVGLVLGVVNSVLILLNIYKCRALHKWKRTIKKKFRWIFLVVLFMGVAITAAFKMTNQLSIGDGGGDANGGANGSGGAGGGRGAGGGGGGARFAGGNAQSTTLSKSADGEISKPSAIPLQNKSDNSQKPQGANGAGQLEQYLPIITVAIIAAELLLILLMLCCKPAKKKEEDDDDDDDDAGGANNGKSKGGNKGTSKGGDKGGDTSGGNGPPGTMVVDMSKPIQVFIDIPDLRAGGGKNEDPFWMLHGTTASNLYGSSK